MPQLSPSREYFALLPLAALLIVLPFPGTVAARLFLLLCAFCIAAAMRYRCPSPLHHFPPARWAVLLWVAICGLSLIYTHDLRYTLKELQNEVGYAMMALFAFHVASLQLPRPYLLLRSLAIGLLLIGGIALQSWYANGFAWREEGPHGGIGVFCTYLVTCIPVLFWLCLDDPDKRWRYLSAFLIVFSLALALIASQRAVWPTLLAQMLLALYLLRRVGRLTVSNKTLLIAGIAALGVAVAALAISNRMRGLGEITDMVPSASTFAIPVEQQTGTDGDPRLPYWPAIVKTIAEHPWVGVGFGQAMMKKAYPELVPPNFPALWHAHNTLLNYALQMGLPGALAFLLLFFGLARYYWRALAIHPAAAPAAIAGLMLLAGVLLRNQTNDFFRRDMALLFWSLIGIFSALAAPRTIRT